MLHAETAGRVIDSLTDVVCLPVCREFVVRCGLQEYDTIKLYDEDLTAWVSFNRIFKLADTIRNGIALELYIAASTDDASPHMLVVKHQGRFTWNASCDNKEKVRAVLMALLPSFDIEELQNRVCSLTGVFEKQYKASFAFQTSLSGIVGLRDEIEARLSAPPGK